MNLNQVTVLSRDLIKSVPFYQALGLKLIVDSIPRYVRFVCPDGNSTFSLHHTNEEIGRNGPTLYFECEELDKTVERLIEKGFQFTLLPTDQEWLWREAHLSDPDGNRIILYYAGENRVNPPWRVNS